MSNNRNDYRNAMALNDRFKRILKTFPNSVWEYLETIPENRGMLAADPCRSILDTLKISVEELMLQLLPVARLYSRTRISGFRVGAVVRADIPEKSHGTALFLGANIEFPGQPLIQTIHAEQSAVVNAWLHGARQIGSIAVTAAPCGCCRQFLYELEDRQDLTILLPDKSGENRGLYKLPEFLPRAFGPQDLALEGGLTAPKNRPPKLYLQIDSEDRLVLNALAAAQNSYAPYSLNFAGCAILTEDNRIFTGPYAENAAFNPSLPPLHTAMIGMTMDNLGSDSKINRTVLVEKPTSISQRQICELLLQTLAPDVKLEFYKAQ